MDPVRSVCAIALVAACAGDGPGTGANDLDAAPLLAFEEMLRIGSTDDPDYGFTAINGVDVTAMATRSGPSNPSDVASRSSDSTAP
ncbi:MAG TPA: hypothetical protein VMM79_17795 [Longimicrobiales bacterium]|nr:hypothetical protein [Longimicrobiales bacterium]